MAKKSLWARFRQWIWRFLFWIFGTPEQLVVARKQLQEQDKNLEQAREEKLQWMAKEATTRKNLQDSQERSKDLLEQVVKLTHQQREAKKSLLDQKFKIESTPLERQQHEMDLVQARSSQKEAEEKCKRAEEKASRMKRFEKDALRVKGLETQAAWESQQANIMRQALDAVLMKVRHLETKRKPAASKKQRAISAKSTSRRYHKPSIR